MRPVCGAPEIEDPPAPAILDVVACGELLIDFVAEPGVPLGEARQFERAAGGAPANVAVGLARLGWRAGFLGQVGDDPFGHFLVETLREQGVDVGGLHLTSEARTALAFVSLDTDGERDFLFYRHPSADMLWRASPGDVAYAAGTSIFHFGSISLIVDPSRESTLAAVEAARRAGRLISYDPNLRLPLWRSAAAARDGMREGLRWAQIVKVSSEELEFLSGVPAIDPLAGARSLWHDDLRLLAVTRGPSGCLWFTPDANGTVPAFSVRPIDTTGAGDGFVAGLLAGLLETGLNFDREAIERAIRLGSAVGALTTTRRGAIPALPERAAVDTLVKGQQHPRATD